jgi:hypothetical protein
MNVTAESNLVPKYKESEKLQKDNNESNLLEWDKESRQDKDRESGS